MSSVEQRPGDDFVQQHLRRNVLALGGDFALYTVALAFASQATILPAFATTLGAPNIVIGAIPAVSTLGWLLPALFVAGHTETLGQKLPFVLRYTIWERAPYLALALTAFLIAGPAPTLGLALLLLVLLATTGVSGALLPAWMDVVGHAIPVTLRGRFFAVWSILASLGGLAASFATASILAAVAAPASFGVCFVAASLCMALSYVALTLVKEPPAPAPPAERVPLRVYLGRIPALLRRDGNMTWFLAARGCAVVGVMSSGFFTVYALRVLGAPAWRAGVFTTMLLIGQVAGNLVFGWLADRSGHRLVLAAGSAVMVAANVVALCSSSVDQLLVAFVLDGVYDAAIAVSGLNILLELAPTAGERPTYVGLGRTAVAPLAFAAPLAAGLLADAAGFASVFAVGAVFSLFALALLIAYVRDPRRALPVRPFDSTSQST
jgi:MFS family permease